MAAPTSKLWEIDEHTKAKHEILRRYLDAWLPIVGRNFPRLLVVDGFAGPGEYLGGEEGSPLVAVRALNDHAHHSHIKATVDFLFIEEDPDRATHLRDLLEPYRNKLANRSDFDVKNATYEEAFNEALNDLARRKERVVPTFCFIDPFGIKGLPLAVIERLLGSRSTEVLVNIMTGYLNRFISESGFENHCDALFGCKDWRNARQQVGATRETYLKELYASQLRSKVGAKYVRHFTMKNAKNVTIYDLFFATNNDLGIDKMKDAMWKVDDNGSYFFSDATAPGQAYLFSNEPDWPQLVSSLVSEFRNSRRPWDEVAEAIRQSPFRILKRPLVKAFTEHEPPIQIINPTGVKKNTLKERTVIVFP